LSDKVSISITYTWEITQAEWIEGKEFWKETLKEKAEYDARNMYWLLNNIKVPDAKVEIKEIK